MVKWPEALFLPDYLYLLDPWVGCCILVHRPQAAWRYIEPHQRLTRIDLQHMQLGDSVRTIRSKARYGLVDEEINLTPRALRRPDFWRPWTRKKQYHRRNSTLHLQTQIDKKNKNNRKKRTLLIRSSSQNPSSITLNIHGSPRGITKSDTNQQGITGARQHKSNCKQIYKDFPPPGTHHGIAWHKSPKERQKDMLIYQVITRKLVPKDQKIPSKAGRPKRSKHKWKILWKQHHCHW